MSDAYDPFRPKPLAPPVPPGTYTGTLVAIVALGVRRHDYSNKTCESDDVCCVFEYEGDDGVRHFISRDVALSYHRKSVCWAAMSAMLGAKATSNSSLSECLGRSCNVVIVRKKSEDGTREYGKLDTFIALKKGEPSLTPTHEPFLWKKGDDPVKLRAGWLPYSYGKPLSEVVGV
jgi:hypothetical protein